MVKYNDPFRPIPIATGGRAKVNQLIQFFTETNPKIDINFLNKIAHTYIDEAAAEGINSDIAFCQMVHEANYLQFGGDGPTVWLIRKVQPRIQLIQHYLKENVPGGDT